MNCVMLCGRLTKDPVVKDARETKVAKFTLAVDRKYKKGETDFINCTAFGKTAGVIEEYVSKGTKIIVEGRWQTGSYDKDGVKIYTNDCIVDSFEFCESKGDKRSESNDDDFVQIPDDIMEDIPFKNPS